MIGPVPHPLLLVPLPEYPELPEDDGCPVRGIALGVALGCLYWLLVFAWLLWAWL